MKKFLREIKLMDIINQLTTEFNLKPEHANNIVNLLDEGNTIPFIARYRKEMTGAIDDQILRQFVDRYEYLKNLEKRKEEVRKSITDQGKMTEELEAAIEACITMTEVEDVYRLFTNRNYAIRDKDGRPIGYARSVWAMISMQTRKPIDLLSVNGGSIREFICDAPCPIDTPSRIKVAAEKEAASLRAKYSDIDVNGHVNSIRYIEHILDLFPLELYREKRVRRFEMAYVAESYYDDLLSFYVDREAESNTYAAAIRKNGDETVCRAKIIFDNNQIHL